MSTHQLFPMESRPYGDTHTLKAHAKAVCSTCHREEWRIVHNPGLASKVFAGAGWLIGSRRSTDVCPGCRNQKPKRLDLTPSQKRTAYNRIEASKIAKQDAVPPEVHVEPTPTFMSPLREPITGVISTELGEQIKAKLEREKLWPAKVKTAGRGSSRTSGFAENNGATRAARSYFAAHGNPEPVPGRDYIYFRRPDGWAWVPCNIALPEELAAFKAGRKQAVKSNAGKSTPGSKLGERINAMAQLVKQTEAQPDAQREVPTAERPMTREDRRRIMDTLDRAYDQDQERYFGGGSDQFIADQLNVPRVWIKEVRVQAYGDHDRNMAQAETGKKLDEAIALADAATARLIDMAQEAEKLANDLKVARARLG